MANQAPFVDDGGLLIDSPSQGSKKLTGVESFKVNDGQEREPVMEIGSKRPVGTTRKKGAITIDIEYKPRTVPDVDYDAMNESGEYFDFTCTHQGGAKRGERWQYKCQVAKWEPGGGDAEGKYSASVQYMVIGKGIRLSRGQA